jgi:hypothetical protein
MPSPFIAAVIGIAIVGWFATIAAIQQTKLTSARKRLLIIPAWLPWLMLALGAPIAQGVLPIVGALNIGGALTAGMLLPMIVSWLQGH